jgi:3-hydroxybutyryl-CoA dehydratase
MSVLAVGLAASYHSRHSMNTFGQNTHSTESSEAGFPRVGVCLPSRVRTVTEADITMFSALTGDWHPQHSNAEWAKNSLFGGRIAHGLLLLSFAIGLVELDPEQVILLRQLRHVVFKRPIYIGETIGVHALVELVRPVYENSALLGLRWRVVNSREETVLRAQVDVLCRTRLTEVTLCASTNDDSFVPVYTHSDAHR